MYTLSLTDNYFTNEEKSIFREYLNLHGLEENVWDVFNCLFRTGNKNNQPLILRVFKGSELCGAAIILKCRKYGKSLFKTRLLYGIMDLLKIPFHLWVKFGCCMDMMSNSGFIKNPDETEDIHKAMADYLRKNKFLTIVNDYSLNKNLYRAAVLPALPHALVNTSSMDQLEDYTDHFKNIKRKLRVFKSKGGEYKRIESQLNDEQIGSLKKCFVSTAEKSVFYLPYQDLYLKSAIETSKTPIKNVHYFIATINNEFIGYQAAIKSGKHLNALHGAFDRQRKSNYHAYDILFVKMAEFAIENNLESIDFGAVLNVTKQKMINQSIDLSYFVMSKYKLIQKLFSLFLKLTKVQGKDQLKFRN